ncbi:MAG: DUF3137 domain-containing protein [Candidatus Omnitrophica bacterium]|nr:DUF3137 domain-containing protein [Candidatus Omnitrophota bacterium]
MKTLQELKDFYDTILLPDLQSLENIRLRNLKKMVAWIVPILIGSFLLVILLRDGGDVAGFIIFFAFIISGMIIAYITKGYITDFKQTIIEKIVHFIDADLSYQTAEYIESFQYKESKLFLTSYDIYKGDDRVYGKVGATAVNFSEVHTQYITRDSKGRTSYHTIFKGLFFVGDFNKNFQGRTFILPDTAESLFGGIGKLFQSWDASRPELVKLEDPEFERLFVVYADDQIEARYILSPSLMKRIIDFKKKSGKNVRLSFLNSNVYVAISYYKNLFEPRIFQTLLDFNPIKEYFEDLQLATGIVEDLNLNLRIWTKD